MEMCYDGALVMPSDYAVMDEEEMMYVEGGDRYDRTYIRFGLTEKTANYVQAFGVGVLIGEITKALAATSFAGAVLIPAAVAVVAAYFYDNVADGDIWYTFLVNKTKRLVTWKYEGKTTIINLGIL